MTPDRTSIINHLEHLAAQNRREPNPNIPAAIALEAAASDVRAGIDEVTTDPSCA